MRSLALAAALAGAAAAAAAPAASTAAVPPPPSARSAVTLEDVAAARRASLANARVNKATKLMQRDPACRQHATRRSSFTDDAPSAALLAAFKLLRRPAIPEDTPSPSALAALEWSGASEIYQQWYRMGRAADGSEHFLVTAHDRRRLTPLSRVCLRNRHAHLVRLLARDDPRVRRGALRSERQMNREEQPAAGFPQEEAIWLYDRTADGSIGFNGGGGVSLAWVRRHGLFSTEGASDDDRSRVVGLIPDGVESIEATFDQHARVPPHTAPDLYPEPVTRTYLVQDNLVSFDVEREASDAFPARMVWRAADGSVVRVVHDAG